jgi:hypothetical protein
MEAQIIFGVLSIAVFALIMIVKPGQSLFG